jgi:SAM-dependent methyltransferase
MPPLPREHVACNLCASQDTQPWARVGETCLVQCQECGLVYTNPRPMLAALRASYETEYAEQHQDQDLLRQRRVMYRQEREAILHRVTGGRFLDVGCGTGEFLALMADCFEVHGVDVSKSYLDYGKERLGLDHLHHGQLDEAGLPGGHFDVVQMRGVIQHLPDPLAQAREACRVTRPGGLLVVSATPNITSLCARLYRDRFRLLAPDHMLYDFSPITLRRLLERAGWDAREFVYPYVRTPYFRWWQGLQVLRDALLLSLERLPGVPRFALKSPPCFGNMMTCYARKPLVSG